MKKILTITVLSTMLVFTACRKEKSNLAVAVRTGSDNAEAETEMNALFLSVNDFATAYQSNSTHKVLPSEAKIIITDSNFSTNNGIAFIIDFGPYKPTTPHGIPCLDGRYRAGKVYGTLSKPYREIGAVLTLTLSDSGMFYSGNGTDMFGVVGIKTLTRETENRFKVIVPEIKIKDVEGKTVIWSCNRAVTKIKDAGIGVLSDIYSIAGSGNGTNKDGEKYTVNITKDLIKNISPGCASTFIDGVIELENTDKKAKMTLDFNPYNDAACDRVAKVTIGKTEKIFYIK